MNLKNISILINILFFIYFAFQLLVFTDEFALNNIGFFNHAVAGLAEIIGIVFLSFSLSLMIIFFKRLEKQFPFFLTIFLVQFIIGTNFLRYVLTNSPGESNLYNISLNATVFLITSLVTLYILLKNK